MNTRPRKWKVHSFWRHIDFLIKSEVSSHDWLFQRFVEVRDSLMDLRNKSVKDEGERRSIEQGLNKRYFQNLYKGTEKTNSEMFYETEGYTRRFRWSIQVLS